MKTLGFSVSELFLQKFCGIGLAISDNETTLPPSDNTSLTGTTQHTTQGIGTMATLTHRRHNSNLTSNVILFAESGNEQYGSNVWTLATELPYAGDDTGLIAFAAEFYGVDVDEATSLVNPSDIVDSAGAWDDQQFVSECWQRFERTGYRTYDGAVVLDKDGVKLTFSVAE